MLSPATYGLAGMREALLENAGLADLWSYIWPLLVVAAIAIPVDLWVFASAERYAR